MINGRMLYRVKPILNHPPPMTLRQFRGFFGIADYCHIWILGYEEPAQPLYNLITEPQQAQTDKLAWSPETQKAFSSVQFSQSVISDSLQPHGPQHARNPCPSTNHSLPKLMSIELGMPANHLILCHLLLLLPSSFPASESVLMSQLFA